MQHRAGLSESTAVATKRGLAFIPLDDPSRHISITWRKSAGSLFTCQATCILVIGCSCKHTSFAATPKLSCLSKQRRSGLFRGQDKVGGMANDSLDVVDSPLVKFNGFSALRTVLPADLSLALKRQAIRRCAKTRCGALYVCVRHSLDRYQG